MRRLITVGLAAITLAVANVTVLHSVGAQSDPGASPPAAAPHEMPVSFIDDIAIPYDVLDYVHMTYQGHAVIHAHKMRRGGQEVYRLQIASDEKSSQSIYLFYDMNWQLLGDEPVAAPPTRHAEPERHAEMHAEQEPQQAQESQRAPEERPDPREVQQPDESQEPSDEPAQQPADNIPMRGRGRDN